MNQTAMHQLHWEIWKNRVNRDRPITVAERRYLPWLSEMRPPSSWFEFVAGLLLAMTEQSGRIYKRHKNFAYLVARAFEIPCARTRCDDDDKCMLLRKSLSLG